MDDQSSDTVAVEALLSTICAEDDPAEVFFNMMPTPKEIHGVTDADTQQALNERIGHVLEAVILLVCEHDRNTEDPDFAYILNSILNSMNIMAKENRQEPRSCMGFTLAYVALMNSRDGKASSQGKKKDQLLAYYLWRLHGSKDETSPIHVPASTNPTGMSNAAPHDLLPSSRTSRGDCSHCGNTQATSWCSGCRITKSGKVVFATFYCDRGCMEAHWKVHKRACKEVRTLRHSAAIFTDIWFEVMQLMKGNKFLSITEENGLIEAKTFPPDRPVSLDQRPFHPFPRHLVESEEQMLACVLAGSCEEIIGKGKILFDHIMRPACALLEEVRVYPKNGHKTVYLSYPDDTHDFPIMCFHLVFRITLRSGLRFAFDPTGAQNGWQETLAPWDAYEQHRVHSIHDIRTSRPWLGGLGNEGELEWFPIFSAWFSCMRRLTGGTTERALYDLPDANFETVRESIAKAFREKLISFEEPIETNGESIAKAFRESLMSFEDPTN